MGDLSTKDSKTDDQERKTCPTGHVIVDVPDERLVLHRVPAQVREGKNQIYEPVLVSLGPYHHDRSQVEDLKGEILDKHALLDSDGREKLLEEIRNRLGEIRSFYGGVSSKEYEDEALTEMMLRDACFLFYCMKMKIGADHDDKCIIQRRLGMSRVAFVVRDFFMLENQLPFWILKKLISLTSDNQAVSTDAWSDDNDHGNNGVEAFFYKLLSSMINCSQLPRVPWEDKQGTLHLLHARRATLVLHKETSMKSPCCSIFKSRDETKKKKMKKKTSANILFRSVKDLKAKGIHFRQSSYCLKDIRFTSHSFYGKLRLPILSLDNNTNVIFSNIIALEMSPGSASDFAVISYIKFMKSLIEKAEDVKELREKGIILSGVASDEEVVTMFKEFNTDGSCSKDIFREIRERINEHCSSKAKTFKAEFIHTYFRTPWTAIALFAAILLLCINCLNFILNYYRMHRPLKRT